MKSFCAQNLHKWTPNAHLQIPLTYYVVICKLLQLSGLERQPRTASSSKTHLNTIQFCATPNNVGAATFGVRFGAGCFLITCTLCLVELISSCLRFATGAHGTSSGLIDCGFTRTPIILVNPIRWLILSLVRIKLSCISSTEHVLGIQAEDCSRNWENDVPEIYSLSC